MISTEHWPSPFENTPAFDADGVLETSLKEDQRLAIGAGVQIVECDASTEECTSCGGCVDGRIVYLRRQQTLADPGIVPEEVG